MLESGIKPSSRNTALPLGTTLPLRMLREVTWFNTVQLEWQNQDSEPKFVWHQNVCFLLYISATYTYYIFPVWACDHRKVFILPSRNKFRYTASSFLFSLLHFFPPLSSPPFSFSLVFFPFLVFPPLPPPAISCSGRPGNTQKGQGGHKRLLSFDLINLSPTYQG